MSGLNNELMRSIFCTPPEQEVWKVIREGKLQFQGDLVKGSSFEVEEVCGAIEHFANTQIVRVDGDCTSYDSVIELVVNPEDIYPVKILTDSRQVLKTYRVYHEIIRFVEGEPGGPPGFVPRKIAHRMEFEELVKDRWGEIVNPRTVSNKLIGYHRRDIGTQWTECLGIIYVGDGKTLVCWPGFETVDFEFYDSERPRRCIDRRGVPGRHTRSPRRTMIEGIDPLYVIPPSSNDGNSQEDEPDPPGDPPEDEEELDPGPDPEPTDETDDGEGSGDDDVDPDSDPEEVNVDDDPEPDPPGDPPDEEEEEEVDDETDSDEESEPEIDEIEVDDEPTSLFETFEGHIFTAEGLETLSGDDLPSYVEKHDRVLTVVENNSRFLAEDHTRREALIVKIDEKAAALMSLLTDLNAQAAVASSQLDELKALRDSL